MDTNKQERERGITINVTAKEFETDTYHYSLVDCPGHKDYIGNMITGSSTTEAAILMLPAAGFETAISKGEDGKQEGQTRQHARLIFFSGIKQIIVCINKMDDPIIDFSKDRFNEIKDEAIHMLVQAGYGTDKKARTEKERIERVKQTIPIIPIAGLKGLNLVGQKATEMPWYKGFNVERIDGTTVSGETLYDALDKYVLPPKREDDKPLRVPIGQVLQLPIGVVVTGRIEQGILNKGDNVIFSPSGVTAKAFTIETHNKQMDSAHSGDNIGVNVKINEKGRFPKRGDVMCLAGEKLYEAYEFVASVAIQDHPGELKVGYTPNIMIRTAHAPCRMTEIKARLGKDTNKILVEGGDLCSMIKQGNTAKVVFRRQTPMYVEPFSKCEGLGRLAIMDGGRLVGLGKIEEVTYLTPEFKKKLDDEAKAAAEAKRALNKNKKK